jgi:hypothetical protein
MIMKQHRPHKAKEQTAQQQQQQQRKSLPKN